MWALDALFALAILGVTLSVIVAILGAKITHIVLVQIPAGVAISACCAVRSRRTSGAGGTGRAERALFALDALGALTVFGRTLRVTVPILGAQVTGEILIQIPAREATLALWALHPRGTL